MFTLTELFGEDATILRERNFQLLLLVNVFPALGTAMLSSVLDSLIKPLGASPASIGLMISVFTAPSIVMIPVGGALADRYGRKPVLVGSLVLFGTAGSAVAFTSTFHQALALRTIQGVAFAGLTPILITSIGDLYSGMREATAQGLRFTGTGLAQTMFPLLAGMLVVVGWQYPFLLFAFALPIALIVAQGYDEPPIADDSPSDPRSNREALFDVLRQRPVVALVVARSLGPVVWIAFLTYNSLIVVRLIGGTPGEAGLMVAIGSLVFAFSASQAGRVTDLFGNRLYPLVAANASLTVGFALVLFAPDIPTAAGGVIIVGSGFGLAISLYRSIVTGLAPDELRAGLVSVAESGSRVVVTLTPIVIGGIMALVEPVTGFRNALQLAGISVATVSGGGGILCLFVARASPEVHSQPADQDVD